MIIITASYAIGILLGLYLEINIAFFVAVFTVLFLLFMIPLFSLKVINSYNKVKLLLFAAFIVLVSSCIYVNCRESKFQTAYTELNGESECIGTVVAEEKESDYYYNYIVKIKSVNGSNKYEGIQILLKINKRMKVHRLEYGDFICAIVNLEKPEGRRNYKGYDYANFLKTKNVYMIGKLNANEVKVIKKNSLFVVNMWINSFRITLKNNLVNLLPQETASVSLALLLGDSSMLIDEQRETFSQANMSHILAISGMHVGFVVAGLSLMLKRFDKRKTKYIMIVFLVFFSELTGGSASVLRAVIMSCIAISSKLFYRKSDTLNNIAIACLIILLINPYSILNLGFELSVAGTLGIVLFNNRILDKCNRFIKFDFSNKIVNNIMKKLEVVIVLAISANILIFPILAYNFNNISFTFLVTCVLVAPILGIMCVLGYFMLIVSLLSMKFAKFFAVIFNEVIKLFNIIALFGSRMSFTSFLVGTPKYMLIIIYYVLICYLFYFYKKEHNKFLIKICFTIMIVIFANYFISRNYSGFKLYFIDVGQGDGCLMVTQTNKRILIDGGGSESESYDIGEKVLVPYLLDRGICKIDYLIFSHFDSDHCKGLFTVMEKLSVKNAVVSEQGGYSANYGYFLELADSKDINVIYVQARG